MGLREKGLSIEVRHLNRVGGHHKGAKIINNTLFLRLSHLDQLVVITGTEVFGPNKVVRDIDRDVRRLTEILRLLIEENFEQSRIFSMEMLELDFLACVLEAEKAELPNLFFIESFFMGIEGTLSFKVVLRDFITVQGHFSSPLLEI